MLYIKPDVSTLGGASDVIEGFKIISHEPFPNAVQPRVFVPDCELDE